MINLDLVSDYCYLRGDSIGHLNFYLCMSGLIPLIHGDFDNRFEHGERVWSYKLKIKKHVNYLKQLIFVWVEENEPMEYPNYQRTSY